jgi:hypothetical protein
VPLISCASLAFLSTNILHLVLLLQPVPSILVGAWNAVENLIQHNDSEPANHVQTKRPCVLFVFIDPL